MRQSKRRRQQEQQTLRDNTSRNEMHLMHVEPKTINQSKSFREFRSGKHCVFKGSAGVGKTFIALFLALEAVVNQAKYAQVVILRSARASVDVGHLPGNLKEKLEAYEAPYRETVNKLFDNDQAYDKLKQKGVIRFESTSYLRGMTFDDCVVVMDESQNMSRNETHTVATRVGENCQLVVLGDKAQLDYMKNEKSGFEWFCSILDRVPNVSTIQFTADDVVRSGFCRDYLRAFENSYEREFSRRLEAA